LSKILSNVALVTGAGTGGAIVTAAFKALPTDHVQSTPDVEDPVASATTCRGAVNLMVEMVRKACVDVGNALPDFVVEEDIVRYVTLTSTPARHSFVTSMLCESLSEAQRMTSIYAKLEYNFKRLLWLGS
jgi:phosphatidylinositol 4-phosphatase